MVLQNGMKIFFKKLPKRPLCVNINVPKKKMTLGYIVDM